MGAALVFGQMAAALLIDATGALGMAVRGVTPTRLVAAGLVAAGLLLWRLQDRFRNGRSEVKYLENMRINGVCRGLQRDGHWSRSSDRQS